MTRLLMNRRFPWSFRLGETVLKYVSKLLFVFHYASVNVHALPTSIDFI